MVLDRLVAERDRSDARSDSALMDLSHVSDYTRILTGSRRAYFGVANSSSDDDPDFNTSPCRQALR